MFIVLVNVIIYKYREKNKDKIKKYYIDNKTRLNVYKNNWMKNKIKNDILYKLKHNIKSNITQSIKRKGLKKNNIN